MRKLIKDLMHLMLNLVHLSTDEAVDEPQLRDPPKRAQIPRTMQRSPQRQIRHPQTSPDRAAHHYA
jgi:hypothetical protein